MATRTAVPSPTSGPVPTLDDTASNLFLPLINNPEVATATPLPPAETAVPSPTPYPTLDFTAVRDELAAQGVAFAPVKIGFHVGISGNTAGLEQWMRALDAAGIPFFLKSVDNAQPIFLAQEMMRQSGVPHVLVYRKSAQGGSDYDWDVPNYSLPPDQAAELERDLLDLVAIGTVADIMPLLLGRSLRIRDVRAVGKGKHLKLTVDSHAGGHAIDAIAFNQGERARELQPLAILPNIDFQ